MGKGRAPSFQFYPADFIADRSVRAMSLEARGAYITLLCVAWDSDEAGVLPDDDEFLAAVSDARDRWPEIRPQVARAFVIRGGRWVQRRMVEEREAQARRYEQAKRGAEKTNSRNDITRTAWRSAGRSAVAPSSSSSSSEKKSQQIAATAAPVPASVAEPLRAPRMPAGAPDPPNGPGAETPRETPNGDALALVAGLAESLRMPARITDRLDVDRVARAAKPHGAAAVKTAIQLATRWHKAGLRHEGLTDRLVAEYLARRAAIGNPFAYFNGRAFAAMRLRWGADLSQAEHEEIRRLEAAFGESLKTRGP